MARLAGGIFSRPAGKTGGIVFGSARTRTGKVVTAREFVPPSNPNTAAQQEQRTKFSDALAITKAIGPSVYTDALNRAVSQLPGFQSLMSVMLRNLDGAFNLSEPDDIQLGSLHSPNTMTITGGVAAGQIDAVWSIENGTNGTAADTITFMVIPVKALNRVPTAALTATDTRSGSPLTINTGVTAQPFIVGVFLTGVGTAEGQLSLLSWYSVTSA